MRPPLKPTLLDKLCPSLSHTVFFSLLAHTSSHLPRMTLQVYVGPSLGTVFNWYQSRTNANTNTDTSKTQIQTQTQIQIQLQCKYKYRCKCECGWKYIYSYKYKRVLFFSLACTWEGPLLGSVFARQIPPKFCLVSTCPTKSSQEIFPFLTRKSRCLCC